MPAFPRKEASVMELAESVKSGLKDNYDVFPDPPFDNEQLEPMIKQCLTSRNAVNEAQAALEGALKQKDEFFRQLTLSIKKDLQYAAIAAKKNSSKLKLLGWDVRKPRKPRPIPNQPRDLTVEYGDTPGSVWLICKKPKNGTSKSIKTYIFERRDWLADGTITKWENAGFSLNASIRIEDQPVGMRLEYRARASNHSGKSTPSNTVAVIL